MRFQAITQLILVGVSLVIMFTVIRPMFGEIRAGQDEVQRIQGALDAVGQFNAHLAELRSRAQSFDPVAMRSLLTYVPTEVDPLAVSRDMQRIAELNEVTVISIGIDQSSEEDEEAAEDPEEEDADAPPPSLGAEASADLESVRFAFVGVGTYDQITSMLADMERNAYPLRLVSLQFAAAEDMPGYRATAVIETYALPLE